MNPFGNPQKLMKQLQQAQEKVQREVEALEIEATSGGGMVKVVMDGHKNLKSLRIDPEGRRRRPPVFLYNRAPARTSGSRPTGGVRAVPRAGTARPGPFTTRSRRKCGW